MGKISDALAAKRQEIAGSVKGKITSSKPVRAAKSVAKVAKLVTDIPRGLAYNANSPSAGADFRRIGKQSRTGKDPYHSDVIKVRDFCQLVRGKSQQTHSTRIDGHDVDYRPGGPELEGQVAVVLESRDESRLARFAAVLLDRGITVEEWVPTRKIRGKFFLLVDVKTGAQPERR